MFKQLVFTFIIVGAWCMNEVAGQACTAADLAKNCPATGALPNKQCCWYDPKHKAPASCCTAPGSCTLNHSCCPGDTACGFADCCKANQVCDKVDHKDPAAKCTPNKCAQYNVTCNYATQKCCGGVCAGGADLTKITCCKNVVGGDSGVFCTAPDQCSVDGRKCLPSACATLATPCAAATEQCCGAPGSGTGVCYAKTGTCCAGKNGVQTGGYCPNPLVCNKVGGCMHPPPPPLVKSQYQ